VVIREDKRYTAPNAADEAILNEHFYRDVIEEPKPNPTEKQPSERQTEESLDDESPPKPKKKSRGLAGLSRHLEMHGSRRPKEVTETAVANWQSLHNWLSKMRNSRI